jgi:hypothetical protein
VFIKNIFCQDIFADTLHVVGLRRNFQFVRFPIASQGRGASMGASK